MHQRCSYLLLRELNIYSFVYLFTTNCNYCHNSVAGGTWFHATGLTRSVTFRFSCANCIWHAKYCTFLLLLLGRFAEQDSFFRLKEVPFHEIIALSYFISLFHVMLVMYVVWIAVTYCTWFILLYITSILKLFINNVKDGMISDKQNGKSEQ